MDRKIGKSVYGVVATNIRLLCVGSCTKKIVWGHFLAEHALLFTDLHVTWKRVPQDRSFKQSETSQYHKFSCIALQSFIQPQQQRQLFYSREPRSCVLFKKIRKEVIENRRASLFTGFKSPRDVKITSKRLSDRSLWNEQ